MAARVKKQLATPKEIGSPQTNKNEASGSASPKIQNVAGIPKKLGRPFKNPIAAIPGVKKTVQLKAKVRAPRKNALKINPKNFARVLMENGKGLETKKIIVKNGNGEVVKKRGRKPRIPKIKQEIPDELPPFLEPIFPQEDNFDIKKTPKKRGRKAAILVDKIKSEPIDAYEDTNEDVELPISEETPKVAKKPGRQKKPKIDSSLEDVISDLSFLIDNEQIKKEIDDPNLEESRGETATIKKLTQKQRFELIKKDLTKIENIENTLSKLDSADLKLIDRLDLNVKRLKTDLPRVKRRHSIEKFPISSVDSNIDVMPQLSIFSQLPRSLSPKISKRVLKLGGKRSNPYFTRSDSPARMLRNGKQTKNLSLLNGLESPKRRKRVHSDLSGSETASKLSGYDSDSSFSDLASLHGSEKDSDVSKSGAKDTDNLLADEPSSLESKTSQPLIDTNSNVCGNSNNSMEFRAQSRCEIANMSNKNVPVEDAPSSKVPEKGLLLDIMKQTFNDIGVDKSALKGGSAKFYGQLGSTLGEHESDVEEKKVCTRVVVEDEMNVEAVHFEPLESSQLSEEDELRLLLEQSDSDVNNELYKKAEMDEFETSEKETEEDIQDCSDNSGKVLTELVNVSIEPIIEEAPILENETDDTIPVIDNMSVAVLEPPQNLEHLEPPLLESSVPVLEPQVIKPVSRNDQRRSVIDDHKIGIAVTEKDNVVLFSIEHLTDDSGEQEVGGEEINQTLEGKCQEQEGDEFVHNESDSIQTNPELNYSDVNGTAFENSSMLHENDGSVSEQAIVDTQGKFSDSYVNTTATEVEQEKENEEELATEQYKKTDDEVDKRVTEKECDRNSENGSVKNRVNRNKKTSVKEVVSESPEELAKKESILNALGLQSLHTVKGPSNSKKKGKAPTTKETARSTGTLKTVIKINKKKTTNKKSLKLTLQKNKSKNDGDNSTGGEGYKIMKEAGSSSWKHSKESSDSAGAHRKSHYSNRSNMEGSSEQTSEGEQTSGSNDKNQPGKSLIVPEKASSFSIHPGRLCKDECSYCFGKFGLFDTPCHIAQMKSVDRQNKILASEKHLTRDSCLCDACYRHVDRKSNSPSYINKSLKRNSLVAPGPRQNHCHVLGCNNVSTNILRRKWIIKMRKSICQVINIDLDNPGLHSIPICDEHFTALEHLMICAMCKRRLARNHIHYLGPEVGELNEALKDDGIPISLPEKPVVCKLCKCFASIILKDPEERMENSVNFYKEYKKRLLHFNDIVPMNTSIAEEPIVVPTKSDKPGDKKDTELGKKKKRVRNSSNETVNSDDKVGNGEEMDSQIRTRAPSTDTNNSQSAEHSRAQSPEDGDEYGGVDYNTLIPAIAMDCPSDNEGKKDSIKQDRLSKKMSQLELFGSAIEISRTFKTATERNRSNDLAAQKLEQNPSISLKPNYGDSWQDGPSSKLISNPALSVRQLFPGEEELGLAGDIEFRNVLGRTPEGWEKCTATIQYDTETKLLWQELQKPYGSQSSFLRHLILLEKYFRNGDLVLSSSANHHAINYRESVHNRLRAYDNIPSRASNIQPNSMIQFNKMMRTSGGGITNQSSANGLPPVTISQVGRDNENQSSRTPITLQQLNQPPLYPTSSVLNSLNSKNKPPGLISINQRAPAPAAVRAQAPSQKIKFPITKNWRPNLIPIDPSKKHERKAGLVQVISGGKPYHITLEDYKKMCAIKRSFEAKQKKIQEQQALAKQQSLLLNHHSVLKTVVPKKGFFISKTSGGNITESKSISLVPISSAPATITSGAMLSGDSSETILEKLDKQVERLGQGNDLPSISAIALEKNPAIQLIPRIPKSLTVIPQTVRKSETKSSSSGSSDESKP